MENTTHKKSKAGIITFIAVLVLLIIVYLLFTHKDQIFTTKSAVTTKNFTALDNSQGQKSVNTIDNSQTNGSNPTTSGSSAGSKIGNFVTSLFGGGGSTGSNTPVDDTTGLTAGTGLGSTTGTGADNGFDTNTYGSNLTPLPTPDGTPSDTTNPSTANNTLPQCGDGIDNNNNGLIDIKDPGCHLDFNASDTASYDPTINDESRTLTTGTTTSQNMCPSDDPLVFTDAEQAQLQSLLTQYYLLAPTLKSSDDLDALSADITSDQAIIDQAVELTKECISEKADPSYTGPQSIKDNPYYQNPAGSADTYLPTQTSPWIQANLNPSNVPDFLKDYGDFEKKFNIW